MARKYAFGDTDLAAGRLALLAEVFAGPTRAFLAEAAARPVELAVDLGCGPGYTTRLLAETLQPERTVGLDSSRHFLEMAREGAGGLQFMAHDITVVPFPTGPADLVYGRFLLPHLADPEALVPAWFTQLRPGGQLLLEETEWIRTDNSTFSAYLEAVDVLLNERGGRTAIGDLLDQLPDPEGTAGRLSRLATHSPVTGTAARLFLPNLRTWRDEPVFRQAPWPERLARIEQELEDLSTEGGTGIIEWGMRQVAFTREG